MAIGGVPTLGDIDWRGRAQELKQRRSTEFANTFFNQLQSELMAFKPTLTWDAGSQKLIFKPAFDGGSYKQLLNENQLWNKYNAAAKGANVPVDINFFKTQVVPFYKTNSIEGFKRQIATLKNQGIPNETFHQLYKEDPQFKSFIQASAGTGDEVMNQIISEVTPKIQMDSNIMDLAMTAGGTGLAGYGGYKIAPKLVPESWAKHRGIAKGIGGFGAASVAASMLGQRAGLSPEQQRLLNFGLTGAYGVSALGNVASPYLKKRLMDNLVGYETRKGQKADLVKKAKALGIENPKKMKVGNLQTSITDKVREQSLTKTRGQLSKAGIKTSYKTPSSKITVPKFKAPKLPGKVGALVSIAAPFILDYFMGGDSAPEAEVQMPGEDIDASPKYSPSDYVSVYD